MRWRPLCSTCAHPFLQPRSEKYANNVRTAPHVLPAADDRQAVGRKRSSSTEHAIRLARKYGNARDLPLRPERPYGRLHGRRSEWFPIATDTIGASVMSQRSGNRYDAQTQGHSNEVGDRARPFGSVPGPKAPSPEVRRSVGRRSSRERRWPWRSRRVRQACRLRRGSQEFAVHGPGSRHGCAWARLRPASHAALFVLRACDLRLMVRS